VLLLGDGLGFCTDGGMFCMEAGPQSVRFNANLDAIARSGLRVHPLVLRIARNPAGGGS
jgi:YfiR/HmsC-like